MTLMQEWFGLKDEYENFFVANDEHAGMFFARAELDRRLDAILRSARRSNKAPKFVLYGDWGVGKTHTIRHVAHVLKADPEHNAHPVLTDLPDITTKATFQVAHSAFMDSLGLSTAKQWMLQFQTRHPADSTDLIQALTQSEDIAKAFQSLIGFGDGARVAWDWLRGTALSAADAKVVGLSQQLTQSNHLVNVLRMLGALSEEIDGTKLVLMLDEGDKLKAVTNGDAIAHWLNAFRILADKLTNEVGFVVAASFRDPDEMPDALADQQIRTRFGGDEKYLQLRNFDDDQARIFLETLVSTWIDDEKRTQIVANHGSEAGGEDIAHNSFPFTADGLVRFISYACRNGGVTTPRDLQEDLDSILNRAMDDQRHIISAEYMDELTIRG